jgi:hypothetical protein
LGQRPLHHAYVTDRDADSAGLVGARFARGLYAVSTTERMLLLSTKNENGAPEVESIERSRASMRSHVMFRAIWHARPENRRLAQRGTTQSFMNSWTSARHVPC